MVTKGQYLERPTLIALPGGLVLEGVAHRGEHRPGLLILSPIPGEGSGMDHVVAAELAFAVSRAGHPTLRFNYRGVGGSQGQRSTRTAELLDDALAACELAADNAHGAPPVVASIGSSDALALELARRGLVAGVALVSPTLVRAGELEPLGVPLAVVLAEHDPQDRLAWSSLMERQDGALTLVPGADRAWQRNLPLVGKAVAALVLRAGGRAPTGLND